MQHLIELSLASTSWSQATAKRFSPSWSRFGCFKSWNIFFYLDLVLWSLVFKWGAWNDLPDVIIVRRKHESFQHCLFLFLGDCSSSQLYVVKLVLGRFRWRRAIFLLLSWSLSSLDDCWSLEVQMALSSSSSDEDKINFVFKLLLNLSKDFGFESGFWKAEHESLTKKRKKQLTFAFDLRVHEQVWTGSTSLQKFLLLDWTWSPWQIWWLCTNLPIGPNLVMQNWPPSIVTPLWR